MKTLTNFDALTFDCYGTLIDWETGIAAALAPWLARVRRAPSREELFIAFGRHESAQQAETPGMLYPDVLAATVKRMAAEWGVECTDEEARALGSSVGSWPPFPDTREALRDLKRHCKLFILSNIDRHTFQATNSSLDVEFDGIFTAQDIGSYKPDSRNFTYLVSRLSERGIDPLRVLHVAQSVFHDHIPARKIGLATCWITRSHEHDGKGASIANTLGLAADFRFPTLGGLAAAFAHQRR